MFYRKVKMWTREKVIVCAVDMQLDESTVKGKLEKIEHDQGEDLV